MMGTPPHVKRPVDRRFCAWSVVPHSISFLFKALLFPHQSPWECVLPDYQECLASKHSRIDIAPWKLVLGPSDALAELKDFVDFQEKLGLEFSEGKRAMPP